MRFENLILELTKLGLYNKPSTHSKTINANHPIIENGDFARVGRALSKMAGPHVVSDDDAAALLIGNANVISFAPELSMLAKTIFIADVNRDLLEHVERSIQAFKNSSNFLDFIYHLANMLPSGPFDRETISQFYNASLIKKLTLHGDGGIEKLVPDTTTRENIIYLINRYTENRHLIGEQFHFFASPERTQVCREALDNLHI